LRQQADIVLRTYKGIVSSTAKSGYRSDLRAEAVSRASAIRQSQTPKKDAPEKKLLRRTSDLVHRDTVLLASHA